MRQPFPHEVEIRDLGNLPQPLQLCNFHRLLHHVRWQFSAFSNSLAASDSTESRKRLFTQLLTSVLTTEHFSFLPVEREISGPSLAFDFKTFHTFIYISFLPIITRWADHLASTFLEHQVALFMTISFFHLVFLGPFLFLSLGVDRTVESDRKWGREKRN